MDCYASVGGHGVTVGLELCDPPPIPRPPNSTSHRDRVVPGEVANGDAVDARRLGAIEERGHVERIPHGSAGVQPSPAPVRVRNITFGRAKAVPAVGDHAPAVVRQPGAQLGGGTRHGLCLAGLAGPEEIEVAGELPGAVRDPRDLTRDLKACQEASGSACVGTYH